MRNVRHISATFRLSALFVFGIMAIGLPAAHAAEFKLEGSTFTIKGLASESIAGTSAAGKLLIPALFTLPCTSADASGTVLLGGVAHMTLYFLGCTVEGNPFCTVYPSEADAKAKTQAGAFLASGLGSLVLMGGKHYLLFSPLALITLSGTFCTLPFSNAVTGSMVFSIPNALTSLVNQTLVPLTQAETESLFPSDKLTFNAQAAWFDGFSTTVSLSGPNKGKTWGAE